MISLSVLVGFSCAAPQEREPPVAQDYPVLGEVARDDEGSRSLSEVPAQPRELAARASGVASPTTTVPLARDIEETRVASPTWKIELFGPTHASDLAVEREFYSTFTKVWRSGDTIRAFGLLDEAIAERPSRRELRLLRAAVALDGFGELARPIHTLSGSFSPAARLDCSTILFVLAEYQETFPARPERAVPWSGLYHPYVFEHAIGPDVRLWSHGLRPLLRANALTAGDLDLYESFGDDQSSLVEKVLSAQLQAVRGDAAAARAALRIPLEKYVGRQYIVRWRSMLSALETIVESLSTASYDEAWRLLELWRGAVEETIPEAAGSLVTLPPKALKAAKSPSDARTVAEMAGVDRVLQALRASTQPGERSVDKDSENDRALRSELIDAFLRTAMRLRDFRADNLMRITVGDSSGVFSDCSTADGQLACFPEDGKCLEFALAANAVVPKRGWVIPCSGGWVLQLKLERR